MRDSLTDSAHPSWAMGLKGFLLSFCALCVLGGPSPGLPAQQASQEAAEEQVATALDAGQLEAALGAARAAIQQYPRSSRLAELLGVALFKSGQAAEARAAFTRATELDAKVPENFFNLALVELSEKKYAPAVAALEKCVRLDPRNAQAHLLLGRAEHNLNRTLPAIEEFNKALALSPRLQLAHYHLGYAYQSQGDLKAALSEFRKEIEVNPGFCDAYWLAGEIELKEAKYGPAESLFRKATALDPNPAAAGQPACAGRAHYGLARVLAARKQWAEAETELKRVLAAEPGFVEAHYALARVYQEMGRKTDARREFEICARLNARRQRGAPGIAGQQQ